MFHRSTRRTPQVPVTEATPRHRGHEVTSEFSASICRFVLECSCGVTFDTNYIDEALEWRELHQALAPLSDRLAVTSRT